MKFYNLEAVGKIWLQVVDSLPATTSVDEGRVAYSKQSEKVYFRSNLGWTEFTTIVPDTITRGLVAGGYNTSYVNSIEYMNIATLGDSGYAFGELSGGRVVFQAALSNGPNKRGVFCGGSVSGVGYVNSIEFVTINIASNSSDFGDMSTIRTLGDCGFSNTTNERGVIPGGSPSYGVGTNLIEYITINSASNAQDFGDLLSTNFYLTSSTGNGVHERGTIGGSNLYANTIEYVTINSAGNSTDFGDLTLGRGELSAASNLTNERGFFACGYYGGGAGGYNIIDYITINTPGNATDFGDALLAKIRNTSMSNGTLERGIICGGETNPGGAKQNVIEYITINTPGNSQDFGDLSITRSYSPGTCSG